jgi:hypothetical protein
MIQQTITTAITAESSCGRKGNNSQVALAPMAAWVCHIILVVLSELSRQNQAKYRL